MGINADKIRELGDGSVPGYDPYWEIGERQNVQLKSGDGSCR
jgi:hypothetical protein